MVSLPLYSYEEWGIQETRYRHIARHYLRGWFCIDFFSCVPVQYVQMIIQSETAEGSENLRIFKILRLVRPQHLLDCSTPQRCFGLE